MDLQINDNMRLTKFRVMKYRSIEDSGEIPVDANLTCNHGFYMCLTPTQKVIKPILIVFFSSLRPAILFKDEQTLIHIHTTKTCY